jgi:hypothetical protein
MEEEEEGQQEHGGVLGAPSGHPGARIGSVSDLLQVAEDDEEDDADEEGTAAHEEEHEDAVAGMTYEQLQQLGALAGVVSRGLAAETLALLPRGSLAQVRRAAAAAVVVGGGGKAPPPPLAREPEARCAICCCEYEEEEEKCGAAAAPDATDANAEDNDDPNLQLVLLPCGHSFHDGCATRWLGGERKACPTCAAEVDESGARTVAERWLLEVVSDK